MKIRDKKLKKDVTGFEEVIKVLREDRRELVEALEEIAKRRDGAGWLARATLDRIKAREAGDET